PTHAWPHPIIIQAVGGKLRLVNDTKEPLLIRKKDHFCQARLTVSDHSQEPSKIRTSSSPPKITAPDLFPVESVRMDPDGLLSASGKASFMSLPREFQVVFDPRILGYNGAAGPIEGIVNMGPVEPPQRKGHPAPGFSSLSNGATLRQYGFAVEVGRVKNPNKNPVAEKCVAELGDELLRICPE
ncbi:unnamed protein product, partial [Porites evermanni]